MIDLTISPWKYYDKRPMKHYIQTTSVMTFKKAEQVKQQVLQGMKLLEFIKHHRLKCKERWCHCKIAEIDEILGDKA